LEKEQVMQHIGLQRYDKVLFDSNILA